MYAQKKCIVHQDAEDCEYNVGIANTRLSKFDSTSSQVVAPLHAYISREHVTRLVKFMLDSSCYVLHSSNYKGDFVMLSSRILPRGGNYYSSTCKGHCL